MINGQCNRFCARSWSAFALGAVADLEAVPLLETLAKQGHREPTVVRELQDAIAKICERSAKRAR
jgi:hypothetical protein